jgi:hypothetical protein
MFAIAACEVEGPVGPAGPAGAQGPQGPPGPTGASGSLNRIDFAGVFDSTGTFRAPLPAASVSGGSIPVVACYVSPEGDKWLVVSHVPYPDTATFCGLTGIGTTLPEIIIVNGTVGWRYHLIVLW